MTRILALDLAKKTGYARMRADGLVDSGALDMSEAPGEHPGARWKRLRSLLTSFAMGSDWIVWEAVVNFGGNFARSGLFGLEVQLVEVAYEIGAETKTVMPSSLKKFATGSGRATKEEMVAAAAKRWPRVTFETHDQADAMWVLAWAQKEIGA